MTVVADVFAHQSSVPTPMILRCATSAIVPTDVRAFASSAKKMSSLSPMNVAVVAWPNPWSAQHSMDIVSGLVRVPNYQTSLKAVLFQDVSASQNVPVMMPIVPAHVRVQRSNCPITAKPQIVTVRANVPSLAHSVRRCVAGSGLLLFLKGVPFPGANARWSVRMQRSSVDPYAMDADHRPFPDNAQFLGASARMSALI